MKTLKDIKLFLLDMDGTIYFESTLIDGASDFINCLKEQGKKFVFVTNNSSQSASDYIEKMNRIGIACNADNVFTSGMAMGIFLSTKKPGKRVYLMGTKALENELKSYSVNLVTEKADIVVVGFDRELTYSKLEAACTFLDDGAEFLATNIDLVCPMKGGRFIPDCGSMCKMITNATGKEPIYIGKPERSMIDILAQKFGIDNSEIAMVGDRIYTDIKTGINAGSTAILVLSGETNQEVLDASDVKPHYVFRSVKELYEAIR